VEQIRSCRVASFYVDPLAPYRCPKVSRTVFLARHGSHAEVGQILSGRSDIGLSERGRAEARRLADRLQDVPLARIFSSPRRRTRETASIVAERHDCDVESADALDEIDFGAWTGRTFAELAPDPDWRGWNEARATAATPAGDTMAAATRRAVDHIQSIEESGPVLCVSHCDIIRGVAAHYLGLSHDRLLAFDCDPASLSALALDGDRGRVVTLNERPA